MISLSPGKSVLAKKIQVCLAALAFLDSLTLMLKLKAMDMISSARWTILAFLTYEHMSKHSFQIQIHFE
ncbi:unnamed protein product [Camellia sinensis]